MKRLALGAGIIVILLLLFNNAAIFASPPADFQTQPIITSGLEGPTGFEFSPDGRIFILERTGKVKIYKNGQLLSTSFVDLPSIGSGDRGLIGIAFDPNYASNHYVYFYYTGLDKLNRLVRFDATNDTASGLGTVIFQTTFPSEQLHVGGSIRFGTDGKLYFAVGDNGYPPNAQDLSNPHGKILRINKNGTIPSDNPFFGQSGKLGEIWAYGFRNPWRFQFDSQTGKLYVGDVGNDTWEEVNLVTKGANYGWPVCEGSCNNPNFVNPTYAYNHDDTSSAITMGPVYRSNLFPPEYRGKLFFGDYARGFIRTMNLDNNGNSAGVADFDTAAGSVVDLKVAPDGSLYYITYFPARLYKIGHQPNNPAPVANASADKLGGNPPLTVNFSSANSSDPNGNTLIFLWKFGDGTTSTQANPQKVYSQVGVYVVELEVSDGTSTTQAIPLTIQVGTPPSILINSPVDSSKYKAGDTINYTVSATDGAGNDVDDNDIIVEVRFHHDTHFHPFYGPINGRTGSFTIPSFGEPSANTWYELIAKATDANGLSTTKTVNIFPEKVTITITTNPTGLIVNLDGSPITAPLSFEQVVNYQRELDAVSPQSLNGKNYVFSSWSDTLSQKHKYNTPTINTTYTANYIETTAPIGFTGQYFNNQNLQGTPVVTRTDPSINFDWGYVSPGQNIPADHFSVRWTQISQFEDGEYEFTTTADDGVRVKVDGITIIDKWIDQGATTYKVKRQMTAGNHTVLMEFYDNTEDAVAKLSWVKTSTTPPPPTGDFRAEFFSNKTLSGSPVLVRNDTNVNFDWGLSSPGAGIPADQFSVRWTKKVNFTSGTYKFSVTGDDGVRLKIDGVTIIDQWKDQGATTYTTDRTLTAGDHDIVFEFYDNFEDAVAKLSWQEVSTPPPPPPTGNYKGEYFSNQTLSGIPILTRDDTNINFDWGYSSPGPGVPAEHFSARWTKTQNFEAGNYRFSTTADDGVRVFVDGVLIIDKWKDQGATTYTADKTLTAGDHAIKMEFYDSTEDAVAKLSWSIVGTPPPPIGFTGEYFNNINLGGTPVLTRTDGNINFDWVYGSPDPSVNADFFSVRWTKIQNFEAGTYRFSTTADDGVRVKIDGVTIIEAWKDQGATTYTADKTLSADNHTLLMEFYDKTEDAVAKLSWIKL